MERVTTELDGKPVYIPTDEGALHLENVGDGLTGMLALSGMPISRLAQYEDEDEKGLLLHLPCKMFDTIYMIVTKRARVYSKPFRFVKTTQMTWSNLHEVLEKYGVSVFLTKEEAKATMKRMNEGDDDGKA